MASYGSLSVLVRADTTSLERSISQTASRAGSEAGTSISRSLSTSLAKKGVGLVGGGLRTIGHGLNVAATRVGVAAGGVLGTALFKGFNRLKDIQNAQVQLQGLGYTTGQVKTVMDGALTAVQGTAFGLGEAATAAAQMSSAGMPLKDTAQTLSLIADAATIGNTSMGDMASIFSKVQAQGKLTGDTLQQMSDRGIGAIGFLAKELDVPRAQVAKLVSEGKVDFATFQSAMQHGLGGAAQRAGKTVQGSLQNVGAALSRLGAGLLQSTFKQLPRMFNTITKAIDAITPTAEKVGTAIGKYVRRAFEWIMRNWPKIQNAFKAFVSTAGPAFRKVWERISGPLQRVADFLGTISDKASKGQGGIQGFAKRLGRMAPALTGAAGGLMLFDKYGATLTPMLTGAVGKIGSFVSEAGGIGPAFSKLGELAKGGLGKLLSPGGLLIGGFALLLAASPQLRKTLMDLVQTLIRSLMPAFTAIMNGIKPIIPPIMQIARLIGNQLAVVIKQLTPLLPPIGRLIGVVLKNAFAILMPIIRMLVPIIGFLAKLLGGALSAALKVLTPILRILIGVMTWWQKNVMAPVIKVVQNLISWLFTGKPSLAAAVRPLKKLFETVWNGIKKAVSVVWNNVLHPTFNAIGRAVNVMAGAFRWLWHKVIQPVWNGIKGAISTVWDWIKKWVFTPIHKAVDAVGGVFRWLWKKAVIPTWNGIKGAIKTVWNWISRYVFTPIHKAVDALAGAFRWLWHKVMQPVWDGIKTAIKWPWDHIIKPIIDAFHNAPDTLAKVWRGFKKAIGTIFDNIKKAVGTPIWFVADKILKPIIKGINFLITKIGIHPIDTDWIQSIPHFPMAQGGKVPGTGNQDTVPALLTPGEWVLTKKQSQQIGYATLRNLPRFADGGPVPSTRNIHTDEDLRRWIDKNAPERGVVGSFGAVVAEGGKLLRAAAANAFEAMTKPLRNLAQPYADMQVPPGNAMWQFIGKMMLTTIDKAIAFIRGHSEAEGVDAASQAALAVIKVAENQLGKMYEWGAKGPANFDCSGLVQYSYIHGAKIDPGPNTAQQINAGHFVNSPLPADMVFYFNPGVGSPHHVALSLGGQKVIHAPDQGMPVQYGEISNAGMSGDTRKIKRILKEAAVNVAASASTKAVDAWAPQIEQAFNAVGARPLPELVSAIKGIMAPESGGNPRAMNDYDVNWTNGIPSVGLMQMTTTNLQTYGTPGTNIPVTLRGPRGHTFTVPAWMVDPVTNIAAALRYMQSRYGSIGQALTFRRQHNWYDRGGLLQPGVTVMENKTRKPEPVLTNEQWRKLTAAATANRDGGRGPLHVAGGSLDIGPDSQGRLRAWVQDVVLEEADYGASYGRMGGGAW